MAANHQICLCLGVVPNCPSSKICARKVGSSNLGVAYCLQYASTKHHVGCDFEVQSVNVHTNKSSTPLERYTQLCRVHSHTKLHAHCADCRREWRNRDGSHAKVLQVLLAAQPSHETVSHPRVPKSADQNWQPIVPTILPTLPVPCTRDPHSGPLIHYQRYAKGTNERSKTLRLLQATVPTSSVTSSEQRQCHFPGTSDRIQVLEEVG